MPVNQALIDNFKLLKSGTLWHNPDFGKPKHPCAGFADSNPGEARTIENFVNALALSDNAPVPTLQTATGRGIVGMLHAMIAVEPGATRRGVVSAASLHVPGE